MGYLSYVKEIWKAPKKTLGVDYRDNMVAWRKEPVTVRVKRPTRIDRARSVGYKAKQGILVVRQRVIRGGHTHPDIKGGRRPSANGQRKVVSSSYQVIAEQRANKKYVNCEVLGSYEVGKDGRNYWYEIVLADRDHPVIKADKQLSWLFDNRGKAFRGTTSAGKKSRGLRTKGTGAESLRPSKNAVIQRKVKRQNS